MLILKNSTFRLITERLKLMKQFLRYLYLVAAMLMVVVGDAWGQCYVLNEPNEIEHNGNNKSKEFTLIGPGNKLTFQAKRSATGVGTLRVDQYVDGQWENIYDKNPGKVEKTFIGIETQVGYENYEVNISRYATKLKFYTQTISYSKFFKDVKVAWATYADQPSATSWTADTKIIGSPDEALTITMAWSNTAAFSCKISGGGKNQFSAEISEGNASTCSYGTAKIFLTYKHNVLGTHEASLEISNGTYTYNIPLKGTTLDKYDAVLAWSIANTSANTGTYHVSDNLPLSNIYTITNQTTGQAVSLPVEFSVETLERSIIYQADGDANNDNDVISIEDGQVIAKNAGKAKIIAKFDGNDSYKPFESELTLTINKYTPEFTWKDPVYFNQALIEDYFTTNNKDTKISITNQTDRDVADLYFSTSDPSDLHTLDLTSYNKEASTTLTVTQAENYYWYEKTETKVVTPIDPNNHVPFKIDSEANMGIFVTKSDGEGNEWKSGLRLGESEWDDNEKSMIINFRGVPDKLSFKLEYTSQISVQEIWGTSAPVVTVYEGSKSDAITSQIFVKNDNRNAVDVSIVLSPATKWLKLNYDGNYGVIFKDLTVTELEEFHAVDKEDESKEVERLDFGANQVNIPATLKFDLKYANAGYKVKLESNDSRFTIEPTSISDIGGCRYGKREISVTYNSNVPCQIEGESSFLTITDEIGHSDKVYLVASSYKPAQTLEWRADFKVEKPIIRLKEGQIADAATATSGMPVTYISSNTEVIAISDDGKILIPKAEGEVTITATQAGNETWQPVSDTKTFIVTDKIIQYIGWSDALTDLIIGGPDVTLTAKVYLRDEATQTYYYSEERTKLLQYSVEDNKVVIVSGNVLSIKGVGQTTATAVAPGDVDYAEATLTIPVRVRTESDGCEDVLLLNHTDDVEFFAYNTNEIIQGPFDIDRGKGVPGTLSFQHRGASWDLGIQYYGGTIKAQYVTDDNTTWTDAKEVTPIEDKATFESGISLPRNATQVRFVRPSGGTGYHYVSNIQVHPAQYLETQAEINFGEIHVGSTETKPLEVYYSNIKDVVAISASSGDVVVYPTSFGECGKYGKSTIDVTWIPSVVSADAQEQVTLRDNISGMESVVTLKAVVAKGTQNIYWPERPTTISNCGDIGFPEETTAHLSIIWEVIDGKDVADFNGNGELELYKQGTITVKGSNTGNANYNEFYIEYEFSIEYKPIFVGTENTYWNNPNNWSVCRVPSEEDVVTIQAPAELTTSARVKGINFVEGGTLHVASTGGMTVGEDGISGAVDGSIVIDNTPSGVGYLRIAPTANKPAKVTVKYTTKTYDNGWPRYEVWQYIGMPGENAKMEGLDNRVTFYNWDETRGWLKQNYTSHTNIPAWTGYAFTQSQEENATFNIVAEPTWGDKTIDFTYTADGMVGDNLMVNSYLAPIDITKIESTDVEDPHGVLTKTFFLFNAGSWSDWKSGASDIVASGYDQSSAGHYYSIPFYSAKNMKSGDAQLVIPSMQGVYVYTEGRASLKLNYAKHVYAADEANNLNQPMRAPQQMYADSFRRVCIQVVSENSGADRMYVMQDMNTTADYDNGYDGDNIIASGQVNIYTNEHFGQMEVSCSNDIDSTYIGFTAGEDSEYSLNISAVVGDDMYLVDLDNENIIPLLEEQRYEFYAVPNSVNDRRFMLIKRSVSNPDNEQDGTPTDVQDLYYEQSLWIHDNILYISQAPMNSILSIYTVSGTLVATPQTISNAPYSQELNLPTGVYMLRLNDKVYKFVCK